MWSAYSIYHDLARKWIRTAQREASSELEHSSTQGLENPRDLCARKKESVFYDWMPTTLTGRGLAGIGVALEI